MSKKGYYDIKTREEWRPVDYIEIFDLDSGDNLSEQGPKKDSEASYIC